MYKKSVKIHLKKSKKYIRIQNTQNNLRIIKIQHKYKNKHIKTKKRNKIQTKMQKTKKSQKIQHIYRN